MRSKVIAFDMDARQEYRFLSSDSSLLALGRSELALGEAAELFLKGDTTFKPFRTGRFYFVVTGSEGAHQLSISKVGNKAAKQK